MYRVSWDIRDRTLLNLIYVNMPQDTQQTQNICTTFVQRRPNVFDAGPTLYICYTNALCFLGRQLQPLSC